LKYLVVGIAILVVIAAFIVVVKKRKNGIRKHTMLVHLPVGWTEISGQSPRAYKRSEKGSGILQISLFPPSSTAINSGADAELQLERMMEAMSSSELGNRIVLTYDQAKTGIMATALYKNEKQGLFQVWLVCGEVNIFATYTMGSLETVQTEIQEAAKIVKDITLD